MAKADAANLKRLIEEQEKALRDTDNQLEQWNKFRSDYVALRDRLKTLPNKTTHNVMVPFGSLAFMPGQLVHTNEIMVLLGDNYFVERSAIQAADIVTRRVKKLDENIHALKKQREILTPRAQFTSDMLQMAAGGGEQQEIREEYDEERERQWRERHREFLREAGERQMKETAEKKKSKATTPTSKAAKTDSDYWDILDRLEQQENKRRELTDSEEDEEEEEEEPQAENQPDAARNADRLADDDDSSLEESEEEDDEEEEDSSAKEEEEESKVTWPRKVITFSHTKQQDNQTSRRRDPADDNDSMENNKDIVINSPADLYRLVKTAPKSILKKTPSRDRDRDNHHKGAVRSSPSEDAERKVTFGRDQFEGGKSGVNCAGASASFLRGTSGGERLDQTERGASGGKLTPATPRVQAFSDKVVERQSTGQHSNSQQPRNEDSSTSQQSQPATAYTASSSRPVSKFRTARQKAEAVSSQSQEGAHQQLTVNSGAAASLGGGDAGSIASSRPVSKFRASRMKQGGGS